MSFGDPSRRGTLQVLLGAVLISFSPVFVRWAQIDPDLAGIYRTAFGAAALAVYVLARRLPLVRGWLPLGFAVACGVVFAADLAFWHRAIHLVGPGLATILGNFQVFFLAAFGIVVYRERPGWRYLVSIPAALTGLALLIGIDWSSLPSSYRAGIGMGMLTAISYATYVILFQRSQDPKWGSRRLDPAVSLLYISMATALSLTALFFADGGDAGAFVLETPRAWVAMSSYGVLCQAIGWILISVGLPRIPTSRAGLLLLVQPTLSFVWDIVLFGRPTGPLESIGAALALAAIYFGSTRKR